MKQTFFGAIVLLLSYTSIFAQIDSIYYGQTPPNNEAIIFAPNVISTTGRYEHDICFSPNGKEMFFTISKSNWTDFTIFTSKWVDTAWSVPDTATFSQQYKNTEISFSPDGNSVLFASSAPPGAEPWNFAIFKSIKTESGWESPVEIGIKSVQPSTNDGNWHPTIASDGTVFFSSYNSGNYNIYFSEQSNGTYNSFNSVGSAINSSSNEYYPWISPDKKFLIFASDRSGGYGKSDLYISYSEESGNWSQPINMGSTVNSSDDESCPRITADGKYLFFTRTKNWDGDFYWVKTDFIGNLSLNVLNKASYNNIVSVYPNPSSGQINIDIKQTANFLKLCIHDLNGREIFSTSSLTTKTLDLSSFRKGYYILSLYYNSKTVTKKLLLY